MSSKKNLPQEFADLWPDIFNEIEMNVVPLDYVRTVEITFKNEKTWEIEFGEDNTEEELEELEEELFGMLSEYDDEIQAIDFRLDTDKIKEDISHTTSEFLKNRKL